MARDDPHGRCVGESEAFGANAFAGPCELVFEVRDSEIAATIEVVRKVMVDAPHPYLQIAVPLQVDVKAAHNWGDAH